TGYIRSLAGAQMAPAQFMLEALRYHFSKEYDAHQRKREASMQRAIRRILTSNFDGLEFRTNITLRVDGRALTDIDLVVIDKLLGNIFVVQLKYQDLYGGDYRSERAKSERLLSETAKWLAATEQWLSPDSHEQIKPALGLQKSFKVSRIYRLVLTRHF